MPATVEALMIALVALMPGAIYTWSFERIAGRWGIGLSDRLYRFVGISAIFHVLIAPGSYAIWREHLRTEQAFQTLPLWMWGVVAGLVFVPGCLGTFVGTAHAKNKPWAKAVVGPTAAPTAWDAVFSGDPTGSLVLLRLKSGAWVGGEYAHGSYAGGFPEPTDLYLVKELSVDQDEGDFIRDPSGEPVPVSTYGLLVRWDEVEYLEIGD